MNLIQVHNEAMRLLGYTNQDGVIDDIAQDRLLNIGNAVFADLNIDKEFERLVSVQDEIPLDEKIISDVFVWGVAMWIAMQNYDGDNQAIMQSMYNQKKHKLNKIKTVEDCFQ